WDDVLRVHARGTFSVTAPACRWWRAEHKAGRGGYGRIVNTSTGLLMLGGAGQSNYVAAKAAVLAFTEAVAQEMAPYGVTANTIMPSAYTRLAAIGWRSRQNRENATTPFDWGDPVHVAEMACYLSSPAGGWITGQTFQVRGGIVEHIRTFEIDSVIERTDRGWTASDYAAELPRMFGAGSRRATPPPKDWQEQYRERGTSSTDPSAPPDSDGVA